MEVKKVDFTYGKFEEVKKSKKDYKDKEVALLQYFINTTTDIDKWNNPTAVLNALDWLIEVLGYMQQNRKKQKETKGLNKVLYGVHIQEENFGTLLNYYRKMNGGLGK